MKKVKIYKGFIIAQDKKDPNEWAVFTKDEWEMGEGYRTPEFECQSLKECKENIDSY